MIEPLMSYRISPEAFFCYVLQPDLEFYTLVADKTGKRIYTNSFKKMILNISDDLLKYKFGQECFDKIQEWLAGKKQ